MTGRRWPRGCAPTGSLQALSAPIWHKVAESTQQLRQAMTQKMPVVGLQQHLQQLTAALTDVFAS